MKINQIDLEYLPYEGEPIVGGIVLSFGATTVRFKPSPSQAREIRELITPLVSIWFKEITDA